MRHVRPETLARYSEGDLSDRKAARIRSHLASCARCARLRDDLAAVPALLADAVVPPLPEHLAARIQTALMTESARRASPAGAARAAGSADPARAAGAAGAAGAARPDRAAHPGRPHRSSRPRRAAPGGRLAWTSPRAATVAAGAAIIVVVGGGSYAIVQGLSGGSTGTSSSGSAASAAVPRTGAESRAAAPGGLSAGPAVTYLHGGKPASFTPIATTTDFVPGRLAGQVRAALAGGLASRSSPRIASPLVTPGRATSQGTSNSSGAPVGIGGFSVTGLAGCVSRITAGRLVLLVDVATYQSSPAAVIVAAASPQQPRQVWVVGTGCSASASDVLEHLTLAAGR
jgi:Putative zinc-finger